jgi:hypothetical protein
MARSTLIRTVLLGVAFALAIAPGCAKQGEGERCAPNAAGNTDCDDGLVCVQGEELLDDVETADDFGRCCPPEGQAISDERCTRSSGTSGTAGTGGMSSAAGAAGEAGTPGAAGDGGTSGGGGAGGEPGSNGGASGDGGAPAASGSSSGGQSGASGAAGAGGG